MKSLFRYIIVIGFIVIITAFVMDAVVMPAYVRHNQSRYLVNVERRPLTEALARLRAEGFKGVVSDTLYTNDTEPNTVVDQYPRPNTRVKSGRTIHLTIVRPEKLVQVPNLLGQSRRSAEITLHKLGLVIDTVYTEYNPEYPKGTVAWQSPKGGDWLKKGLGVHLTISEGLPPNSYQVPNLFGLSQLRAEEELNKAGLKLGKVYYQQNEDLVPYTVLDQSIAAGTVLDQPMAIDLTVSVLDLQDIFNQMMKQ
jgi:beta-lactam-binding protein with PASTA domain